MCVLASRAEARGLERAARAGVPGIVVPEPGDVRAALEPFGAELVVLAGYMRILPRTVLDSYPDRVVNVHPSLLPAFPGATAVADALAYGVRVTGVTVHLVDEGIDTGPVLLQEAVDVSYDDTPSELLERLHHVERRLLPEAVRLIAAGRVEVDGRHVRVGEHR